jgi:CheY-like chemotaxis protein
MTADDGPVVGGREQPPATGCIAEIKPRALADVTGTIKSRHALALAGTPACRYVLADETGELDLLFLGRVEIAGLEPGRRCRAEGRTAVRDGRIVIWNPRYRLLPAESGWQRGPDESRSGQGPGSQARVLVADGDQATRELLRRCLPVAGYLVDLAATGADALELVRRDPDLIILDAELPDLDTLTTIGKIQAQSTAPILVLAAPTAPVTPAEALAAGASECMTKPVDVTLLLAWMGRTRVWACRHQLSASRTPVRR